MNCETVITTYKRESNFIFYTYISVAEITFTIMYSLQHNLYVINSYIVIENCVISIYRGKFSFPTNVKIKLTYQV